MTIIVTSLGGTDCEDGQVLNAADLVDTFEAAQNLTTTTTLLLDDVTSNSSSYELKKTITVTLPAGVYRRMNFNFENLTTVSNATCSFAVTKNGTSPGTGNDAPFAMLRTSDGTAIGSNIGNYSAECSVIVGNTDVIRVYIKKTGANQSYGADVFLTKTIDTEVSIT